MLHRKILDPALARLDGERAIYFQRLVEKLDEDPRTEKAPNLIYLVLKESLSYLPVYLEPDQVIVLLLKFVEVNRGELNRILYSREYVNDPSSIKLVTDKFVSEVLSSTLEKFDDGQIETDEKKIYRVSWPYDEVEFPFKDMDEE